MKVVLKPHVGVKRNGEQVTLPQSIIVVDGEEVGYVGHQPQAPICFLRRLADAGREAIVAEVTRLTGYDPARVSEPPVRVDPETFDDDLDG